MKRLLILLMLFISIWAQGQSTIDHLGKIRMRYNNSGSNDTTWMYFVGDSVYYYSPTNPFHKFNGGVVADSLKLNGGGGWIKTLIPSQWTTIGSYIYYNTGNVGIGTDTPAYSLDVSGLFGADNVETNGTTETVRVGIGSGATEDETNKRYNVFIGHNSGNSITTANNNVFVGYESGKVTNANKNVFVGSWSGKENTTGYSNTFLGASSGVSNTTGYHNTFIGNDVASGNTTSNYNTFLGSGTAYLHKYGNSNVYIGYNARYYGVNFSNELVIDNQKRGSSGNDSALVKTRALIYGTFAADPLDQTLDFNAKTNLHVHTGLFGRKDPYNTTVADTWQTIKMDSVCADRTTSGFVFNADSTGVIIKFNGFIQFSGHAKILNNAASQQTASLFFRLRKNSIEQSQFNTAVGRTFPANGAHDLVSATGVIPVSLNDTLSVQLRTNNTNIDLEQIDSGIFTNQSSFCIFLTQVKSLKEFE